MNEIEAQKEKMKNMFSLKKGEKEKNMNGEKERGDGFNKPVILGVVVIVLGAMSLYYTMNNKSTEATQQPPQFQEAIPQGGYALTPTVEKVEPNQNEEIERLRSEIAIKDQNISNLTNQISTLSQNPQGGSKTIEILKANAIEVKKDASTSIGSWSIYIPENTISPTEKPYFTKDGRLKITLKNGQSIQSNQGVIYE